MNAEKMKKIKEAGFVVTDVDTWLGLTKEESAIVEIRLALADEFDRVRKTNGMTQTELAKKLGKKQPAVARLINHPETATIDNLFKGLMALGVPVSKIAACLLLCNCSN